MTWVKICGITNLEDALVAVDAGADAVGFVFYKKSPRNVAADMVREIVRTLPPRVEKVGVFVDHDSEHIREQAVKAGLTAVQLQGSTSQESVWNDPRPATECVGVSKIIAAIQGDSLKEGSGIGVRRGVRETIFAFLLDSHYNGSPGGTGTTFDWEGTQIMARALGLIAPIIVAGGLTALNVPKALEIFQPFGVDVASGVEAKPGKKDPGKVRAFIAAVCGAEQKI